MRAWEELSWTSGNVSRVDAGFSLLLLPVETIGERTQWWDRSNLANPNAVDPNVSRFGTCGSNTLRTPGLINLDMGVFRKFNVNERITVQVRGEAFNLTNTPDFGNPAADISSGNFGLISGVQNTSRKGNDQRFFRAGNASGSSLQSRSHRFGPPPSPMAALLAFW